MRIQERLRTLLAATVSGLLVGVLVVYGINHGFPPKVADLRPGMVWLSSERVGELALVDGVSVGLADRVRVSRAGDPLIVLQSNSDAYAFNRAHGTIIKVDGATHTRSVPVQLLNASGQRDQALAIGNLVYQIDPESGQLAIADSRDLRTVAGPSTLSPALLGSTLQTTVTDDDRLWLLDTGGRQLTHYSGVQQHTVARNLQATGALLLSSNRFPVLLDQKTGKAQLLDPSDGHTRESLPTSYTTEDVVVGSAEQRGLFIAHTRRGELSICRFGDPHCRTVVYLGGEGSHRFGKPAEIDGHVLVPDHATGKLWIVDLKERAVVAQPVLFQQPVSYELILRDGIIFFNDPSSERAGIVRLDGTVLPIRKYDPIAPRATLAAPSANLDNDRSAMPGPLPSRSVRPTTGDGEGRPTATTTGSPQPGPLRIVRLDISPPSPQVGEAVRFSAAIAGGIPTTWQWSVLRPDLSVVRTASTAEFSHAFDQPGDLRVALVVRLASASAEQAAPFTVTPVMPPVNCGDTVLVNTRLEHDLNCAGYGLFIGASGIELDLNGHTINGPGGSAFTMGIADGLTARMDAPSHSNFTVRNGTIMNFAYGIALNKSINARLVNVRLISSGSGNGYWSTNSGGSGFVWTGGEIRSAGLHFEFTRAFTVTGVTFTRGSIRVFASGSGEMTRNSFTDGHIGILESDRSLVERNRFTHSRLYTYGNTWDMMIRDNDFMDMSSISLEGTFDRSVFEYNRFTNNAAGLSFNGPATDVVVRGNTFTGNGVGMFAGVYALPQFSGATIVDNTFIGNKGAGLYVSRPPSNVIRLLIARNVFRGNGFGGGTADDGLYIDVPPGSDVTVTGNQTFNNADCGIEALAGSVRDGGGNVSTGDPRGCIGVACA